MAGVFYGRANFAASLTYPARVPILTEIHNLWRRLSGSDRYAECLRVLLALGGIVAWCLLQGDFAAAIPALLGAIACALAETEDRWRHRLTTLLLTLACFALAAFAVQWLFGMPWLFALSLPLATFALVMLGAASQRYATIGWATLLLSIYMMLVCDLSPGPPANILAEPLKLLAGAAWYGLLSLSWSALAPQQALRQSLAQLFDALADYLDAKAALFEPVHEIDRDALHLALAMRNEKVVQALNETRLVLIDRIDSRGPRGTLAMRLRLYFGAQDIHERISSAHHPYDALAQAFFHSDVLFRCRHLLRRQARSCRRHAESMRLRMPMSCDPNDQLALQDLRESITSLKHQPTETMKPLLASLDALQRNLEAIQAQLDDEPASSTPETDAGLALQNPGPQSLREGLLRIRSQLTPRAFRFRHALRLALGLLAGYGLLHVVHPQNGYWILMTTLLVCQPSYHATRRQLLLRVAGTIAGLIGGWAALQLFSSNWQLLLITPSAVLFFAARQRRYALATASITVFVVLCFNQVGSGYEVMWPRLIDTLIGASIAALAIRFVLPDWQGRRFNQLLADTIHNDACYLARIMPQYQSGKRDDLDYRIARRDAHNADATLSGVLANMLREPGHQRQGSEHLLRFLGASHSLLGHLSALGVHRQVTGSEASQTVLAQAGGMTVTALQTLASSLATNDAASGHMARPTLPDPQALDSEVARLALGQLNLVLDQHDCLVALIPELARN